MTLHGSTESTFELADVALDIAGQRRPADMVDRVAQLAATLINCAAADLIRITGSGELRVTASSDPRLSERTRNAWRRWPHLAIPEFHPSDDTAATAGRSRYVQQLGADTGVVQELIVPLVAGPTDHGYLRFLITERSAGPHDWPLITAFCTHAAIALDRAALLVQVDSLRSALDSNRTIGAAVGVLMARHGITYADGLDRLKTASQNANRRLHDVANAVLCTGQLPVATPPRRSSGSAA
jgi:hypothetical protein